MCHGGGGGGDDQDTPRSVGRKEAGSRFPIPCTNQRPVKVTNKEAEEDVTRSGALCRLTFRPAHYTTKTSSVALWMGSGWRAIIAS